MADWKPTNNAERVLPQEGEEITATIPTEEQEITTTIPTEEQEITITTIGSQTYTVHRCQEQLKEITETTKIDTAGTLIDNNITSRGLNFRKAVAEKRREEVNLADSVANETAEDNDFRDAHAFLGDFLVAGNPSPTTMRKATRKM